MAGLTPEQREAFAEVRCRQGHRFDGFNYPTPEGICPFCVFPEFKYDVAVTRLGDQDEQPRGTLHPSLLNGR